VIAVGPRTEEENMSDGVPQFKTAEYSGKTAGTCKACGQAISGAYYQINGAKACPKCAQRIKEQLPKDTHAAFVRGVLFGVGGAILGLGIYVGFALATGLIAGLVSLAVGYIVGKAILIGSGGLGGRRYQLAAVVLTYAAVSLAAVPIAVSQHMKQRSAQAQSQVGESSSNSPRPSIAMAVGTLALIGLASPLLALANPMQGVIGLIILFVGIRIAWRMTAARQVSILGPISDPAPAAT
jgi:uncharacterized protein (DUF983 family)